MPTPRTLRELHEAHLLAVPFENLDIGLGRPIALDENALLAKIVARRRGGFCYELNGAFAWLLRALGFDVTLLSAGVARAGGGFGPEFDHLTLQVQLDEPWLVDVGFGDSFRRPLRLDCEDTQPSGDRRAYRVARDDGYFVLERRADSGPWQTQYRFTLRPRQPEEFAAMCRHHQTSPESHFTRQRICSRATPAGRVTISDSRLIVTTGVGRSERELEDEREWAAALREHFGVDLQA
jgi:N-hydroxyarylamine O-acetyltransferase